MVNPKVEAVTPMPDDHTTSPAEEGANPGTELTPAIAAVLTSDNAPRSSGTPSAPDQEESVVLAISSPSNDGALESRPRAKRGRPSNAVRMARTESKPGVKSIAEPAPQKERVPETIPPLRKESTRIRKPNRAHSPGLPTVKPRRDSSHSKLSKDISSGASKPKVNRDSSPLPVSRPRRDSSVDLKSKFAKDESSTHKPKAIKDSPHLINPKTNRAGRSPTPKGHKDSSPLPKPRASNSSPAVGSKTGRDSSPLTKPKDSSPAPVARATKDSSPGTVPMAGRDSSPVSKPVDTKDSVPLPKQKNTRDSSTVSKPKTRRDSSSRSPTSNSLKDISIVAKLKAREDIYLAPKLKGSRPIEIPRFKLQAIDSSPVSLVKTVGNSAPQVTSDKVEAGSDPSQPFVRAKRGRPSNAALKARASAGAISLPAQLDSSAAIGLPEAEGDRALEVKVTVDEEDVPGMKIDASEHDGSKEMQRTQVESCVVAKPLINEPSPERVAQDVKMEIDTEPETVKAEKFYSSSLKSTEDDAPERKTLEDACPSELRSGTTDGETPVAMGDPTLGLEPPTTSVGNCPVDEKLPTCKEDAPVASFNPSEDVVTPDCKPKVASILEFHLKGGKDRVMELEKTSESKADGTSAGKFEATKRDVALETSSNTLEDSVPELRLLIGKDAPEEKAEIKEQNPLEPDPLSLDDYSTEESRVNVTFEDDSFESNFNASEDQAFSVPKGRSALVKSIGEDGSAGGKNKSVPSDDKTNGKCEGVEGMYQPGSRLEALDMSTNKWYCVKVVEADWDDREVLIHFEKWSQRFDEWIPMDSSRLRPVQQYSQSGKTSRYRVGETVMATWSDSRKYPARVKALLSGDSVEVLFFDGFVKRMRINKIAKCVGDEVFEPALLMPGPGSTTMTKAERRERKRKIHSVAELFHKKPSKKSKGDPLSPRPVSDADSSVAEPSKPKHSDLAASDNEGEKTYINLDTSFTNEEAVIEDITKKKTAEETVKQRPKVKPAFEPKDKPRKRTYNKVFLDDSPAGTMREVYPFKGRRSNEAIPPNDYDNWEPEGQEAYVVETCDGLRRSIIVADDRLPAGWAKHTIQRRSGNSAGKWDVFLVSPNGRRFRSRKEMTTYFTESGLDYKPELFDFTLRGLSKRVVRVPKSKLTAGPAEVAVDAPATSADADSNLQRRVKTLLPKAASLQRGEGQATPPPPPHHPCTLNTGQEAVSVADQGKVFVAGMEIRMRDNAFVCPKEGCLKQFRRENLLQMHMKHYHPEYTQLLGVTPNVADLAYARTVGDSIGDIGTPARTVALAVNRFEASKKSRQLAAMSPPPVSDLDKKKPTVKRDPINEARKAMKTATVVLEQLAPATPPREDLISGAPLDLEQFIKPLKCAAPQQSTPLRDLLRGPKLGLTAGIKTLLPTVRPGETTKKPVNWLAGPAMTAGDAPNAQGKARVRKRRLSDNYADAQAAKKKKLVKWKCVDDSADSATASSSSAGEDAGGARLQASKKRTPILAATLAQPPQDSLDMSEASLGSPLTPLTPLTEEQLNKKDIINCTCGVMEEDGLMIQCDLCLCWQHGYCNSIELESQVPDKYVCHICLHPARERMSMHHRHDQTWLKEGVLPSVGRRRSVAAAARLKRSHDLTATLLDVRTVIGSLRCKVNVADTPDHPKLYLWAKPWERDVFDPPRDSILGAREEDSKSDIDSVDNASILVDPIGQEVKSETIVGEDMKQDVSATVPPMDNQILLQALTGNTVTNNTNNNTGGGGGDLNNQLLQFPICQSELIRFAHSMADNLKVNVTEPASAPEPEKPIDPVECRLLLLDHIQHHQQQIRHKLDELEEQISALEEEDPDTLTEETESFFPQTKQTIKMLLRDLTTVRNIANVN